MEELLKYPLKAGYKAIFIRPPGLRARRYGSTAATVAPVVAPVRLKILYKPVLTDIFKDLYVDVHMEKVSQ